MRMFKLDRIVDASTALQKWFKDFLTAAGLPAMRFHDLRHSCASLMLLQGVPARAVMATLGHSQIAVTMNTYAHVLPELQAEAAVAMDRAVAPQPTSAGRSTAEVIDHRPRS
jgi:integrase